MARTLFLIMILATARAKCDAPTAPTLNTPVDGTLFPPSTTAIDFDWNEPTDWGKDKKPCSCDMYVLKITGPKNQNYNYNCSTNYYLTPLPFSSGVGNWKVQAKNPDASKDSPALNFCILSNPVGPLALSSPANGTVASVFPAMTWTMGSNWGVDCSQSRSFRLEVILRVFASLHVR
jgi:hypothetical protein